MLKQVHPLVLPHHLSHEFTTVSVAIADVQARGNCFSFGNPLFFP